MTEAERTAARTLRVGYVPGVIVRKWQTRWAERFSEPLEVVAVQVESQRDMLDAGGLDLCFVRLPIDRNGLHAIPLYEEVTVAWVAKDHAIAAVDEVSLADLADDTVLTELDEDATDLVLAGCVLMLPMSIARGASRRDLVYRPIVDAPVSTIALSWRIDNENPLIEEFIGVVRGRTVNSSRTARERAASSAPSRAVRAERPRPSRKGRRGRKR